MAAPKVNEQYETDLEKAGGNIERPQTTGTGISAASSHTVTQEDEIEPHYEDLRFDHEELHQLAKTLSRRTTNPGPGEDVGHSAKLENQLRKLLQRADENGQPLPSSKASAYFKGLTVRGSGSGATYQENVGGIFTGPFTAIKSAFSNKKTPEKTILHGIDGVVRDGEMLLVLGRPGSGCSTLLKSLAGFTDGYEGWDGDVNYCGVSVDVIKKRFRGDVVYNPEVDIHFPHLNVKQTLEFAAETHAPRQRMQGVSRQQYIETVRDVLATVFGLDHVLTTKVGDDFVRGVSGGQRKRVSIAEMLATRASVAYWDNSTRGLDASTSLEFAQALRTATNLARNVSVVAIYQAGENLTQLFNKVTVLYLGRQIFFGTIPDANEYFQNLGFFRGPRQTSADFLTAITDPNGRVVKEGYERRVPRTPDEFVKCWKDSSYYQDLLAEMENYQQEFNDEKKGLERFEELHYSQQATRAPKKSPYTLSIGMQLRATIKRGYQRIWGDKVYLFATAFASLFMALINGSVFVQTTPSTAGFFSKGGVMFFAILFNALSSMSEIATQYAQRPIVQKQKSYAMYMAFTDSLATMLADWPIKLVQIIIFDIVLYFMVDLKQDAGAFFIFLLFTYMPSLVMGGIFRSIAAASKAQETAMATAGILLLPLAIYTGYVIPKPSMHPWFKWITYINPLSYAFESLMANEFHGRNALCTSLVPSGPGYENVSIENQVCAVTGSKPGNMYVSGDDYIDVSFQYYYSHIWRNFGILVAFWIFFVALYAFLTEVNAPAPSKGEFLIFIKGKEPEYVKEALRKGVAVDDMEAAQAGDDDMVDRHPTTREGMDAIAKSKDMFTWQNVNYDITLPGGEGRRLLDHVQGFVKPGTLTALMGESGAGKTTLLNVLAQRVDTGVVSGDILVNGSSLDRSFQRRTGYVQQQDLHLAESTVREALRFSALLRQPKEVPLEEKYEYVESVIKMLEMEDYADAVIGSPGSGLNVEQRKRTTIGVELVAKPSLLLFLDEPTSGLDSQSAWSIVRFMRKLASNGQAILCTIHQPSAVLFEQFDRLLLLKKGGQTVYFGDIGENSRTMIDYFERNGGGKCASDANPAEYILDVIGAGATASADRDWYDTWKNSPEFTATTEEITKLSTEYKQRAAQSDAAIDNSTFAMPWFAQYKAVQRRMFEHYWRSPTYIMGKAVLNIFAGLFLGFTFYKANNSAAGLQNKMFAVFMASVLSTPLMNQLQPRFLQLSALYSVREKPSKMYSWTTFVASAIIVEIPFNLVCGTLFFLPWYNAIHFYKSYPESEDSRGAYMWYIYMLFQLFYTTFGQALAAFAPNEQTAATLVTLLFSFVIIFNGVLQPLSQLVNFWHFMYRLSPFTYFIGGILEDVLHGVEVTCATAEINIFQPPSGMTCGDYADPFVNNAFGAIYNRNATSDCEYCRYSVGDQFLATINLKWGERWRNTGIFWAYIIFNVGAVFAAFYIAKVATFSWSGLFSFGGKKGGKAEKKTEDAQQIKGASVQPFPLGAAGAAVGEQAVTK